MNADNNKNPWVDRFNDLVNTCQNEFKRTTQIGMKMVSASQANTQLQETYQQLGEMVVQGLKSGELAWDDDQVKELCEKIEVLKEDIEGYENDVQDLKGE